MSLKRIGIAAVLAAGVLLLAAPATAAGPSSSQGDLAPGHSDNHLGDKKKDRATGLRPFDGHGPGLYGLLDDGINVRQGGWDCYIYPSRWNCTNVVDVVSRPQLVEVHCQQQGEQIFINDYWVYVTTDSGADGFMASYYIDNDTNWIDGVPECPWLYGATPPVR